MDKIKDGDQFTLKWGRLSWIIGWIQYNNKGS